MALTQISTDGVKNDAISAGKIPANAVGSSEIADDAVDQGAIADEAVDEARLQISNAGTNGQFLQKQSGNTGGLTWATVTVPDSDKIEEGNTSVEAVDTGSDGHVKITTEGTERVRVNQAGKLLIGTDTARTAIGATGIPALQVEGLNASDSQISIVRNSDTAAGPYFAMVKTRGTSDGANTIVQADDTLGTLYFTAADGADINQQSAFVRCQVDGTPGANDTPGRLTFATTADGGTTPTERLRIGSAGQLGIGGATYGSSGQVLTSGGSGAAPSWADAGGGPSTGEAYVKLTNGASASDTGSNTFAGASAGSTLASGAANNTFFGQYAGNETSTGDDNVAIGRSAFQQMQTGNKNIAIGSQAGQALKASDTNIAIGYWTFKQNLQSSTPTVDGSIAIGYKALYRGTHGNRNIAIGQESTASLQTGSYNNAIGNASHHSLNGGLYNTSFGDHAGAEITTGDNNIMIGANSGRYNAPSGNVSTADNVICLGNNSISNFYCADTSISSSDKRDKTDITDFTHGLKWINQLKPVTYRWDKRTWYKEYNEDGSLKTEGTPDGSKKRARQHIGFLAQDVLAVEQADGFASKKDDMLVVNLNEDDSAYGLKYERLVPVLVNAIKELSTEVNTLKTKVAALEAA
jgi:hypothetical protein